MQAVEFSVHLERVSHLMDGELPGEDAAREIGRIKAADDAVSRDAWDAYHLIGDILRDGAAGAPPVSAGFSARFSERLSQEPTVMAPAAARELAAKSVSTRATTHGRWQTYALSAAASVAAVTVVGWMALSNIAGNKPAGGELAKAPAAIQPKVAAVPPQTAAALVAAAKPAPASEPEHVHEYLLAHQGISPSTAFQGVAPYVRTVSAAGN